MKKFIRINIKRVICMILCAFILVSSIPAHAAFADMMPDITESVEQISEENSVSDDTLNIIQEKAADPEDEQGLVNDGNNDQNTDASYNDQHDADDTSTGEQQGTVAEQKSDTDTQTPDKTIDEQPAAGQEQQDPTTEQEQQPQQSSTDPELTEELKNILNELPKKEDIGKITGERSEIFAVKAAYSALRAYADKEEEIINLMLYANGDYSKLSEVLKALITEEQYETASDEFREIIDTINTLPIETGELASITAIGDLARYILLLNDTIPEMIEELVSADTAVSEETVSEEEAAAAAVLAAQHFEEKEFFDNNEEFKNLIKSIRNEFKESKEELEYVAAKEAIEDENATLVENDLAPKKLLAAKETEEEIKPEEELRQFPEQLRKLAKELPSAATISELKDKEEIVRSLDIIRLIRTVVELLSGEDTEEVSASDADDYIAENGLETLSEEAKEEYETDIRPILDEREPLLEERLKELEETEKKDEFGDLSALPEALAELIRNIPTNEEIASLTDRSGIWQVKGDISYIKAYEYIYSSEKNLNTKKKNEGTTPTEEELANIFTAEQIAYYKEKILPVLNEKAGLLDALLDTSDWDSISDVIKYALANAEMEETDYENLSAEFKALVAKINALPLTEEEVNTIYFDYGSSSEITLAINLVTRTMPDNVNALSNDEQTLFNNAFGDLIGPRNIIHNLLTERRTAIKGEPMTANRYFWYHPDGENFRNYATKVVCKRLAPNATNNYFTIQASNDWSYSDTNHAIGNNDCDIRIEVFGTYVLVDAMKGNSPTEQYRIDVTMKSASTGKKYLIKSADIEHNFIKWLQVPLGSTKIYPYVDSSENEYLVFVLSEYTVLNDPAPTTSFTYNGSAQGPSNLSNMTRGGTYSATSAGTYTVTYTPNDGYCWSDGTVGTKSITWTIGKATNPISVSNNTLYSTFSTSSQTISMPTGTVSSAQGDVTYVELTDEKSYFTVNKTTGAVTVAANTPANTTGYKYVVKATAAGNGNYNSGSKDITYTIKVAKADNPMTVTDKAVSTTYNSSSTSTISVPSGTVSGAQGTLSYSEKTDTAKKFDVDSSSGVITVAKGTAADKYTYVVTVKASGNSNYNSASEDITYTITVNKATASLTSALVVKENLVYTESAQDVLKTAPVYSSGNEQAIYYRIDDTATGYYLGTDGKSKGVSTGSLWAGSSYRQVFNAGSYKINYLASGGTGNYNQTSVSSVSFTVSKADAYFSTNPSAKSGDFYYTGSGQTLFDTGTKKFTNTTPYYYVSTSSSKLENGSWSTTMPTVTAADTYYLWARLDSSDTANVNAKGQYYTGVSKSISKGTPSITKPTENGSTLTYSGSSQSILGTLGGPTTLTNKGKYYIGFGRGTSSTDAPTSWIEITSSTTVSTDALKQTNANTYYVWYKFETSDSSNVNSVGATYAFLKKIEQKAITITATAKSTTYGQTVPTWGYSQSGLVSGDSIDTIKYKITNSSGTEITPSNKTAKGTYTITPYNGSNSNYKFTYVAKNWTVAARPVTVTAENKTTTYGQTIPSWTVTVTSGTSSGATGLISGDSLGTLSYSIKNGTSAITANNKTAKGEYSINPNYTGNSNYSITYVAGKWTVNARPVTVTAENKTSTYGQTIPSWSVIVTSGTSSGTTGLISSDSLGTLSYSIKNGTSAFTANNKTAKGEYSINPSYTGNSNYSITYEAGKWTVNARPVTVTAVNKNTTYGDAVPTWTYSTNTGSTSTTVGLMSGDTLSGTATYDIKNSSSNTITPTTSTAQGSYQIIPTGGLSNSNYTITYASGGVWTIAKKSLNTSLTTSSYVYDGEAKTPGVTFSGLVNGETLEVGADEDYIITYDNNTNAGNATANITLVGSSSKANNYTIATGESSKNFTINPENIVVNTPAQSFVYDGTAHGNAVSGITVKGGQSYTVTYSTSSGGTYTDTVPKITHVSESKTVYFKVAAANHNTYSGSYQLSITPKPATLTAVNKTSVYGAALPGWTYSTSDLVGSDSPGTVSYKYNGGNVAPSTATPVGEYTITPYISASANGDYNFSFTDGKWNVTPAEIIVTIGAHEYTYNGCAQGEGLASVAAVNSQTATKTYSLTETGEYSATVPQITNVAESGTIVYYKVTAPNHNEATGSYTLTMNPYNIGTGDKIAVTGINNAEYDGELAWHEPESFTVQMGSDATVVLTKGTDYTLDSWAHTVPSETAPYQSTQTSIIRGIGNYTGNFDVFYVLTRKEYTVRFSLGLSDKGHDDPADQNVRYGLTAKNPFESGFELPGYTLIGWFTDSTKLGNTDYVWSFINNKVVGDMTLYAYIQANTNTPYEVRHYQQQLNGSYGLYSVVSENLTGTTDTEVTPGLRTDWADIGFEMPESQTVKIKGDGTTLVEYLYPRKVYTVTVKVNNAELGAINGNSTDIVLDTVMHGTQLAASGEAITIPNAIRTLNDSEDDTPPGYECSDMVVTALETADTEEWDYSFDGFTADTMTVTDNLTVTANFSKKHFNYDVDFEVNVTNSNTSDNTPAGAAFMDKLWGSITQTKVKDVEYGSEFTRSGNTFTVKGTNVVATAALADEGYTYTFKDFTVYRVEEGAKTEYTGTTVCKGLKVIANFERTPKQYNYTLHINGATLSELSEKGTYTYGEAFTLPVADSDISKFGYTFNGWSHSRTDDTIYVTEIPAGELGDKAVYAYWTPKKYQVKFNANGGKFVIDSEEKDELLLEVEYGGLALPEETPFPTKESDTAYDYGFAGWKTTTAKPEGEDAVWADAPNVGTVPATAHPGDPGTFSDPNDDRTWVVPTYYAAYAPEMKTTKYKLTVVEDTETEDYGEVKAVEYMEVGAGSNLSFENTTKTIGKAPDTKEIVYSSTLELHNVSNRLIMTATATAKPDDAGFIYEFDHWEFQKKDDDGEDVGNVSTAANVAVDNHIVAKAVFKKTPKKYVINYYTGFEGAEETDVKFVLDDVEYDVSQATPREYSCGTEVTLPTLKKKGNRFLGWTDSNVDPVDEKNYEWITKIKETDTGDKTLWAHWSKYLNLLLHSQSWYGTELDPLDGVGNLSIETAEGESVALDQLERGIVYKVTAEENAGNDGIYDFEKWEIKGGYKIWKKQGSGTETAFTEYIDEDWMNDSEIYISFTRDTEIIGRYMYNGSETGIRLKVSGEDPFSVTVNAAADDINKTIGGDPVADDGTVTISAVRMSAESVYTVEIGVPPFTAVTLNYSGAMSPVWTNETGMVVSSNANYQTVMVVNGEYKLVTGEADCYFIEFRSYSGKLLSSGKISKTEGTLEELRDLVPVDPPTRAGKTFKAWVLTDGTGLEGITDISQLKDKTSTLTGNEIIFTPKYEDDTSEVEIAVINVLEGVEKSEDPAYSGKYYIGDNITFTARNYNNLFFSHWAEKDEGGKFVSLGTGNVYPMHVSGAKTIYAIYTRNETTKYPTIKVSTVDVIDEGGKNKIWFQVTRDIPEDVELLQHGVIYSKVNMRKAEINATDEQIEKTLQFAEDPETGENTLPEYISRTSVEAKLKKAVGASLNKHSGLDTYFDATDHTGSKLYVRGYIIVEDRIIYTDVYEVTYNGVVTHKTNKTRTKGSYWIIATSTPDPDQGEEQDIDDDDDDWDEE